VREEIETAGDAKLVLSGGIRGCGILGSIRNVLVGNKWLGPLGGSLPFPTAFLITLGGGEVVEQLLPGGGSAGPREGGLSEWEQG